MVALVEFVGLFVILAALLRSWWWCGNLYDVGLLCAVKVDLLYVVKIGLLCVVKDGLAVCSDRGDDDLYDVHSEIGVAMLHHCGESGVANGSECNC